MEKQNPEMWAKTLAVVGFATWLIGFSWHGMFGYPSMMPMMFGFMGNVGAWSMMSSIYMLPIFVVGGAFYGWLFATAWNWVAKQK